MTYREQIRSPQWIQFAADFKAKRGWQCESCGVPQGPDSELTVHHIYYVTGLMMWNHPPEILECLCWPCHKIRQKRQQSILVAAAAHLKGRPTELLTLEEMPEYLQSTIESNVSPEEEYPHPTDVRNEWMSSGGVMCPSRLWESAMGWFMECHALGNFGIQCEGMDRTEKLNFLLICDGAAEPILQQPYVKGAIERALSDITGEPSTYSILK